MRVSVFIWCRCWHWCLYHAFPFFPFIKHVHLLMIPIVSNHYAFSLFSSALFSNIFTMCNAMFSHVSCTTTYFFFLSLHFFVFLISHQSSLAKHLCGALALPSLCSSSHLPLQQLHRPLLQYERCPLVTSKMSVKRFSWSWIVFSYLVFKRKTIGPFATNAIVHCVNYGAEWDCTLKSKTLVCDKMTQLLTSPISIFKL